MVETTHVWTRFFYLVHNHQFCLRGWHKFGVYSLRYSPYVTYPELSNLFRALFRILKPHSGAEIMGSKHGAGSGLDSLIGARIKCLMGY